MSTYSYNKEELEDFADNIKCSILQDVAKEFDIDHKKLAMYSANTSIMLFKRSRFKAIFEKFLPKLEFSKDSFNIKVIKSDNVVYKTEEEE